jgi:putative DNA primase/helicase
MTGRPLPPYLTFADLYPKSVDLIAQLSRKREEARSGELTAVSDDPEILLEAKTFIPPLRLPGVSLASDIKLKNVEWLWRGYLPRGSLTLLDGDSGLGKSQAALSLAAIVTRGDWWPDAAATAPQGGAVVIAVEDAVESTIGPRLVATGADLNQVALMTGEAAFAWKVTHTALLEKVIDIVNAKIVVIDNLMTHLPSGTDAYKDDNVRAALAPLTTSAQQKDVAILAIRHVGKADHSNVKHRGLGSVAFTAIARSVLYFAPEPGTPDGKVITAMALAKSNLTRPMPTLKFEIASETVANGIVTSRANWLGTSHYTADMLGAGLESGIVAQACRLILELFQEAETEGQRTIPAVKIDDEAKERGIKPWAVKAARKQLKIRPVKVGYPGTWHCELAPKT